MVLNCEYVLANSSWPSIHTLSQIGYSTEHGQPPQKIHLPEAKLLGLFSLLSIASQDAALQQLGELKNGSCIQLSQQF